MGLQERLSACLRQAVENHEAAGVSLLVLKNGKELCHAREGYADIAASCAGIPFSACTASPNL